MIYESEVLPEMLAEVDSTSGGVTTQDNPDISSETR
jgi:hypothetical protein